MALFVLRAGSIDEMPPVLESARARPSKHPGELLGESGRCAAGAEPTPECRVRPATTSSRQGSEGSTGGTHWHVSSTPSPRRRRGDSGATMLTRGARRPKPNKRQLTNKAIKLNELPMAAGTAALARETGAASLMAGHTRHQYDSPPPGTQTRCPYLSHVCLSAPSSSPDSWPSLYF